MNYERDEARLRRLFEVGLLITSSLDLDEVLTRAMDLSRQVMEADACSLMLLDEEAGELVFRIALSEVGEQISERRLPVGQGVAGWVAANREPALIPDAYADERFDRSYDEATGYRTRSILCLPLMVKDRLIGVSQLINKLDGEAFTEGEAELFRMLNAQVAIAIENARLHADRLKREGLERDLAFAHAIQKSFLPQELPREDGVEFAASCSSAMEVGGDLYDVIAFPDGRYAVVIGDVSGKGVSAALYMARLVSEIRHLALRLEEPGAVLSALNDQLAAGAQAGMFVTLVCALLDPATGRLAVANAGHLPPLVRPEGGGTPLVLDEGVGPPLGVLAGTPYIASLHTLEKGQVVALYTDGVVEAQSADRNFFGMERLEETLARAGGPPRAVCERILEAVDTFVGGYAQHDDLTLVTFGTIP
ncbi:MAG: SpoIIE family protein phosphatase [bacterium]|nr:SpoIIE family protein phosphatase [bacterium]